MQELNLKVEQDKYINQLLHAGGGGQSANGQACLSSSNRIKKK